MSPKEKAPPGGGAFRKSELNPDYHPGMMLNPYTTDWFGRWNGFAT